MKFFYTLLVMFNAFLGFNRLAASEVEQPLTYFWDARENELYLNIDLINGLEFAENYRTMQLQNGLGQACEITASPILRGTLFSSEGYQLEEIKLTVLVLNNIENPNQLSFIITTKTFYKGMDEKGKLVSRTSESRTHMALTYQPIDLIQEPEFFTIEGTLNKGIISFKSLL